jgi:O-methyltransferase involved in polyketide biosynthesis
MAGKKGDLSITALYTSATWSWGRLPSAELLATPDAKWVFRFTNAALWLAHLFRRDLPSLRHSLLHRHLVIDQLAADARPTQVIELASGLSRRGVSMSSSPSLRYTEVDLPAVVGRKRELLGRTPSGQAALARENLRLIGSDVTTAPLDKLVEPGASLFVIAEGLFMYLDPDQQLRLWERIRSLFDIAPGIFVFDLVPASEQPKPGLVGRTLERLMKLFTGGRSFERDARSRDDIAAGLRTAGFSSVELIEPRTVARARSLPFADAHTQQLLFVCRP